jgi:AcrR family transcriptional regulator
MSRVDPRRQLEQRGKILRAAASLIASEGYHGMSMRRLAKASGNSLANVYNYFPSKDDILFALQKEAFETLLKATGEALADVPDAVERLYGFISHHVHYFAEHPEVMRTLIHEAASLPDERRRVVRRLKEQYFEIGRCIVRDLVANGCGNPAVAGRRLADDAELERITYSLFGMLNWIYGWYEPPVHGGPRLLARPIHEIALCGLVATCPYRKAQDRMEAHLASVEPPPLVGFLDPGGTGT